MRVFLYEYASAQVVTAGLPPSVVREGRAMLRCLVEDFGRIPGVQVVTIEPQSPETEERVFKQYAANADWTLVVAPEFDGLLLERSRWVEEAGGRMLGHGAKGIEVLSDKYTTYEILRDAATAPRTWLAFERPNDLPERCVIKPRQGAGSVGVQWFGAGTAIPNNYIVQEYVPGQPASIALLIGPARLLPLLPGYQDLGGESGFEYRGGRIPLPGDLCARAIWLGEHVMRALQPIRSHLLGYLGIDLVLGETADQDRIIEINGRVTTSYVGLRQLCEDNLADAMIRAAEGQGVTVRWREGSVRFRAGGAACGLG